jgi:hypothetical protein
MTDVELTRALERGVIDNAGFHHASHLRVAWVYLAESSSVDEAASKMAATLRRFAASVGKPEKYHETITVFWLRALAAAARARPGADLDAILRAEPDLLDKDLLFAYYTRDRLSNDAARLAWLEPDLQPIADVVPAGG